MSHRSANAAAEFLQRCENQLEKSFKSVLPVVTILLTLFGLSWLVNRVVSGRVKDVTVKEFAEKKLEESAGPPQQNVAAEEKKPEESLRRPVGDDVLALLKGFNPPLEPIISPTSKKKSAR
ncbi:hypothetical protein BDK51DRAFT_30220 [Blyttiomyces helicus]|uniref:Uncharacterized protein n=1 Tax=Blyttiomyces helicus TaxID=388810 RepID=A0A4P9VU17_9FUNG|nr:hypothetical protein BDK51DRAFT_30220 [Blyttiomyces helicus]|eukprot:RKO83051.1 hypothetical protein BDK51DRAFT_30220 [Blyttiomyces helicus]